MFKKIFQKLANKNNQVTSEETKTSKDELICCGANVHIAYRGLSDGRQYIAYHLKFADAKYFKHNHLKIFCANCHSRVL